MKTLNQYINCIYLSLSVLWLKSRICQSPPLLFPRVVPFARADEWTILTKDYSLINLNLLTLISNRSAERENNGKHSYVPTCLPGLQLEEREQDVGWFLVSMTFLLASPNAGEVNGCFSPLKKRNVKEVPQSSNRLLIFKLLFFSFFYIVN